MMEMEESFESKINRSDYTILVVDDVVSNVLLLKILLANEKFQVLTCNNGNACIEICKNQHPDLVLLDVMMGEVSGFTMAKRLRARPETAQLPIIFLTARDTENDTVTGLSLGADDYISKPFSIREVVLRVTAVLRRSNAPALTRPDYVGYKGLQLDIMRKAATIDLQPIQLTKTEFEILALLIQGKGRVFSRSEILSLVWHDDAYVLDRTVDVNIPRLRTKLAQYGSRIITRQGYGYCFQMD